jgi:hypothetical protein
MNLDEVKVEEDGHEAYTGQLECALQEKEDSQYYIIPGRLDEDTEIAMYLVCQLQSFFHTMKKS